MIRTFKERENSFKLERVSIELSNEISIAKYVLKENKISSAYQGIPVKGFGFRGINEGVKTERTLKYQITINIFKCQ